MDEEEARARFEFEQSMAAQQPAPRRATRADLAAKRRERAETKYQRILSQRGEAAKARAEEARNMPLWQRMLLMGGHETDKLLSGGGDIVDFLDYTVTGDTDAFTRTNERETEQTSNDEYFREVAENAGFGNVGAVFPYMSTGVALGPAARYSTGKVFKGVEKGVDATKHGIGGAIMNTAEKATHLPGRMGRVAKRIKTESLDPKDRFITNFGKRPSKADPARKGVLKHILAEGAVGGVEGALHYDMNPVEGIVASIAGSASGHTARPLVSRAPDVRTPIQKELVEWGEDQGMEFMPGLKTGSLRHQTFEAGLRNDRRYMNTINRYDMANDAAMNRTAYKTMGILDDTRIPTDKAARDAYFKQQDDMIRGITPRQLEEHLLNQRKIYQELEASTVGKLDRKAVIRFKDRADALRNSKSPLDRATARELDAINERLTNAYAPYKTTPEGSKYWGNMSRRAKRQGHKISLYDGKQYQEMRQSLTDKMDTSYDTNRTMYRELKAVRDELDESLKRGMGDGSDKLKAWKDANEKYAMTKIVMENGMTKQGELDLNRLGDFFLSKDNQRFLTESGGDRISNLHKMSKIRDMENRQAGGTFTSDRIADPQGKSSLNPWQSFLHSPVSRYTLPILPAAYVRAYSKGYPSRTGLLGMENTLGQHLWEAPGMTRAVAQTSQIHPWILNQGIEGGATLMDGIESVGDSLIDFKDWAKEAWKGE